MKKKFREISLLIVILLVTTFIYVKTSEASDVATQSNIKIQNLKSFPNKAKVGVDILNQDFEKPLYINVEPNTLPKINANIDPYYEIINLSKEKEFTVEYNIYPEEFEFTDVNNSSIKDVVIVVDNSAYINGNQLNGTMNSIMGKFIDNSTFINSNTKYSIITLAKDNRKPLELTSDRSIIQPLTSSIQSGGIQSGSEAYLGNAFLQIDDILQKGRTEASKNIIIMAQENVNYTDTQLKDFKNVIQKNGYNIIVIIEGKKNSDKNINKMSNLVGENGLNLDSNNIFLTGTDENSIANGIMQKVAERIINSTVYKPYIFNTEITFDLLDNFEAESGLVITSENVAKIIDDTKIVYNHIGGNKYRAEPIPIKFSVRVKTNKYGELNFGRSILTYKSLGGEYKKIVLKTPKVIVKNPVKDLIHGLYSGIIDNELVIERSNDENGFMISAGSIVTFASSFKGSGSEFNINLSLHNKIDVKKDEIKVYKVINNVDKKQLKELTYENTVLNENSIVINAINLDNINMESEFLVIYKGKIKEESMEPNLINKITISDLKAEVKLCTPNRKNEEDYKEVLPDLF